MTIKHRMLQAGVASFGFLLTVLPASAGVVSMSTDRSEWEAIAGDRTDIDFESFALAPGQATNYSNPAGLTTGGVTFVGVDGSGSYMLWLGTPTVGATDDFGSGARLRGPEYSPTSYLLLTMPADVIAFGIELASISPYQGSFRIELDSIDVGVVIATQPYPNRQFFGVQTDTPFAQVKIYHTSGNLYNTYGFYDNASYVVASQLPPGGEAGGGETPEVATLLSVATGLLLVGWMRRRHGFTDAVGA